VLNGHVFRYLITWIGRHFSPLLPRWMRRRPTVNLDDYARSRFGVEPEVLIEAIMTSPSSQGYIAGAVSEVLLSRHLRNMGFEVLRIKEKPSGGNQAKNEDARGDFYIRHGSFPADKWLVLESKGLKSNSEFRGGKLDSPEKVYRFLRPMVFAGSGSRELVFKKGEQAYSKAKAKWDAKNPGKAFPPFAWDRATPGPNAARLDGLFKSESELKAWTESFPPEAFSEEAYRTLKGPVRVMETHSPSTRLGPISGLEQAAPLVGEFNIMSVDLFLRTGKHEFVFMNSEAISHSPTSPEHQYQNYTIDILVAGKKDNVRVLPPWYATIQECIEKTKPSFCDLDESQLDGRQESEEGD
jgi:hypothetical protein